MDLILERIRDMGGSHETMPHAFQFMFDVNLCRIEHIYTMIDDLFTTRSCS